MDPTRVLVVSLNSPRDPSENILQSLRSIGQNGHSWDWSILHIQGGCSLKASPLDGLSQEHYDIILLVASDGDTETVEEFLQLIREASCPQPVLVAFAPRTPDVAFRILGLGASDFVTSPFNPVEIVARLSRLLRSRHPDVDLLDDVHRRIGLRQLLGESPAFIEQVKKLPRLAACRSNVLISGDTGTGKEMFARAIHYLGPRARKPFVPVNCGAIPAELMENELFGHEQGAFTGASGTRSGLVHEANGGTLFLDEVDCLPAMAQVKLLRFLQDGEYRPVGSSKTFAVDARVISATNINLERALQEGRFRQDVYYRISTIPMRLPSLSERPEDILLLARHFLRKHSLDNGKSIQDFTRDAIAVLLGHSWPGNVRELEHVVERAVILAEGNVVTGRDIVLTKFEPASIPMSFKDAKADAISHFVRRFLKDTLASNRGNITHAAKSVGMNRRAFWELMRQHGFHAAKKDTLCQLKANPAHQANSQSDQSLG